MLRQHIKEIFMFLRCLRQVDNVFIGFVISHRLWQQLATEKIMFNLLIFVFSALPDFNRSSL